MQVTENVQEKYSPFVHDTNYNDLVKVLHLKNIQKRLSQIYCSQISQIFARREKTISLDVVLKVEQLELNGGCKTFMIGYKISS